eukprot:1195653-Prorocentrum_minimum.AAC.4
MHFLTVLLFIALRIYRELAVCGGACLPKGHVRAAKRVLVLRPLGGGGGGLGGLGLEHPRAAHAHGGDVERRLRAQHQAGERLAEHGAELEGAAVPRGEHRHVGVVGECVQHKHGVLAHGVGGRHHVHALRVRLAPLLACETPRPKRAQGGWIRVSEKPNTKH